ncbi:hypothetical protein DFJ74DRAFT_773438, partial [Hyaloraphidium curvatum]
MRLLQPRQPPGQHRRRLFVRGGRGNSQEDRPPAGPGKALPAERDPRVERGGGPAAARARQVGGLTAVAQWGAITWKLGSVHCPSSKVRPLHTAYSPNGLRLDAIPRVPVLGARGCVLDLIIDLGTGQTMVQQPAARTAV